MFEDLLTLREKARRSLGRGDFEGASEALLRAAEQTHASDHDYAPVLRDLEELLARRGEARGALTVIAYAASNDPSAWARARAFAPSVPPIDRAMLAAARGQPSEAAREMENAGRLAAAALYREKAHEWSAARALWSRLASATERCDAYVAALVRFNLARCAKRSGDAAQAREARVACVRLLDEAADHFESIGQRERAFDCFEVLVQVGREGGAFEDMLEGFVNSIRILREDHLWRFALEHFDTAIDTALERGEATAAAAFAREAAEYARSVSLPSAAIAYTLRQGELCRAAARQHLARGAPVDLAANALLAAVMAFAAAGQYARVGQLYAELAMLDIEASRREQYARAARRTADVADAPVTTSSAVSGRLRDPPGSTEVWQADVIEWEQHGSAVDACADIMLDKRWVDLVRRRAMLARLCALQVESPREGGGGAREAAPVRLAQRLAQLPHYGALAPLEALYEAPDRRVKLAVLEAMQHLFYKRSFVTLRRALRDPDPAIVQRAADSAQALRFDHAFDPLARIYRESSLPNVHAAVLRGLAHIDTTESAEFLLGVLEHAAPADRAAALEALKGAPLGKFVELARRAIAEAPAPLRATLRELLTSRGLAA
jgi:hypothetical protein